MRIKNARLTDTKIGTAKVKVDILPEKRCFPGKSMKPTYITIHDAGNNGDAKNQHNYLKNNNASGSNAKASWHFSVDDNDIVQATPCNRQAWHAGDREGNSTSIGIEISQRTTSSAQKQAYLNAIALTKILMHAYNIPISKVVRHKDWTGKDCPYNLNHNKHGYNWDWFKKQLNSPSNNANNAKTTIDTAIVISNDVDEISAKILKWKLTDAKIININDIEKYAPKKVISIGATVDKLKIKPDTVIRGDNRYSTTRKAIDYAESLKKKH